MSALYLVDDHAILREGLRAVLEGAGHVIHGEAGDPATALADLRRLQQQIDVVLVDLSLGEHSGFEVLAGLQAEGSPVRAVVLSMSAQPRHVSEALRMGAAGYVLKGAPSADLLLAINAVVRGRQHLGAGVAPLVDAGVDGDPTLQAMTLLSARERQILLHVVRGRSSAAIADDLHLSPKTVDTYRSRLMAKLGVDDLPALVRMAVRAGLVDS